MVLWWTTSLDCCVVALVGLKICLVGNFRFGTLQKSWMYREDKNRNDYWKHSFFFFAERPTDVNECEEGTHSCHGDATCTNTIGSYSCSCVDGFSGDGKQCRGKNTSLWDLSKGGGLWPKRFLYCSFPVLLYERLTFQLISNNTVDAHYWF